MAGSGMQSLECQLVRIVNQEPLDPPPEALQKDPKAEKLDVNGKLGQTVGWADVQHKYIVETFDGDLVAIAEDNLEPFEPSPVEEGGFDLAFPATFVQAEAFQDGLERTLLRKSFCVVQMPSTPANRKLALRVSQELGEWERVMPEFEDIYMGRVPGGKRIHWIRPQGSAPEEDSPEKGLAFAEEQLSNLATALTNVCPSFGFVGSSRSNGMLHANCMNRDEEAELISDIQAKPVGAGVIQNHLSFGHRRKLCMIYFLHGSGGTLTLHPHMEEDVSLQCVEGQVVVFRCDTCNYSYTPEGKQLAIQAWVLREALRGETLLEEPALLSFQDDIYRIPEGPRYGGGDESVDCMSMGLRIPCMVNEPECYWQALSLGADGMLKIPLLRWDHDVYFLQGSEDIPGTGMAYTNHIGMLDTPTQMMLFNNEFFGISEDEVTTIDPVQRCLLEAGYDCLFRAGWSRENLNGAEFACCNGSSNSDFETAQLGNWYGPIRKDTRLNITLALAATRLQYTFGMTGRCATIETACSSSLTAIGLMHSSMRPHYGFAGAPGQKQLKYGLACGSNGHFDPFFMISLCTAHMISIKGRCFTFDQSADGYARGEGIAAMHFKVSASEDNARLAMLCGTCMNQDGRSASLTAPHGPSQQECIRHSLRESGIAPLKIQIQELHGTGTALGDPIEVGALRATMMMFDGEIREHPLVKTSSKSNVGHTELCAGICGMMKCVLMGMNACACPNNHIRLLNPHIDSAGYPVYFATEYVDQDKNEGFHGVSSFGFGGSNARGDIWARCVSGPWNTQPNKLNLGLGRERIRLWAELNKISKPPPGNNAARAPLECISDFDDAYLAGQALDGSDAIYCYGSFNGWTKMEKMEWSVSDQKYSFAFPLGEACLEQFQFVADKNENFKIFPASKMADSEARVLGPGIAPEGHRWLVDGRTHGVAQGTLYLITLFWDEDSRQRRVSWEPSYSPEAAELAAELRPYRHRYHLLASWNLWKPVEMTPAKNGESGEFTVQVRIGLERHEGFRFVRDSDGLQAIYPARQRESEVDENSQSWQWTQKGIAAAAAFMEKLGTPRAGDPFTQAHLDAVRDREDFRDIGFQGLAGMDIIKQTSLQTVPACGPDHQGEGKHWLLNGAMGESVTISLRVWEGNITVNATSPKWGVRTWTNQDVARRRKYYITATFNKWGLTEMKPVEGSPGVFLLSVTRWQEDLEAFQIVVDEDRDQVLHPEMQLTDQLLSPALGPDAKGRGLHWGAYTRRGCVLLIHLDTMQEDRRKMVSWTLEEVPGVF